LKPTLERGEWFKVSSLPFEEKSDFFFNFPNELSFTCYMVKDINEAGE
jgi:hypothetical protein